MPGATAVCFRLAFFFSFFGRIVSELPFVLRLPLDGCVPGGASATCGMDVTVSVSTVIVCTSPSPGLPFPPLSLFDVLDCLDVRGGGALVAPDRRSALTLPLSLPLSFCVKFALDLKVLLAEISVISG